MCREKERKVWNNHYELCRHPKRIGEEKEIRYDFTNEILTHQYLRHGGR